MTAGTILDTYRDRLEKSECYVDISEATQDRLNQDVRRYGLRSLGRVAYGVLAFCIEKDSPICVPWLVSPDESLHDIIHGRHGIVTKEFYNVAEVAGFSSFTRRSNRRVDYADFIGTYVIKDGADEAPYTVLCDSSDPGRATIKHVDLIRDLSRQLTDHIIMICASGAESPSSYMKIRAGDATELPYGFERGLKLKLIAEPHDTLGKVRELENYATYALRYGLRQGEYSLLTEKAVAAFRAGRQVSLDELCLEVLDER